MFRQQCSTTELNIYNHQTTNQTLTVLSIFTAQVVLNASVSHLAATQNVLENFSFRRDLLLSGFSKCFAE